MRSGLPLAIRNPSAAAATTKEENNAAAVAALDKPDERGGPAELTPAEEG